MLKLLKTKDHSKARLKIGFWAAFRAPTTVAMGALFSTTFSTGFQGAKIEGFNGKSVTLGWGRD